jgi:hypothetical protein
MTEPNWSTETGSEAPKKRVPTWVWFGGGCCLLALVLTVVGVTFGVVKLKQYAKEAQDPEMQWPKLQKVLPFDERPAHLELKVGVNMTFFGQGLQMFFIEDREHGLFGQLFSAHGETAKELRRSLLDESFAGGFMGKGSRQGMQVDSLEIQGAEHRVMRFVQEHGGQSGEISGPTAQIELSAPGEDHLLVLQLLRTNTRPAGVDAPAPGAEIEDAEIQAFLEPFHVDQVR